METRVALVRGSQISRGEVTVLTRGLSKRGYHITGFAGSRTPLTDAAIGEPVQRLPALSDIQTFAPLAARRVVEAVARRVAGGLVDCLLGLEQALRDYDIYYAAETYNGYSAQCARARLRYGRRLVLYVAENIPFGFENHSSWRHNKRITIPATDLFIAITKRASEALVLEGVPPQKIRVVYPGIDTSHFSPVDAETRLALRTEYGFGPDDVLVLFVGRLHKSKGIRELLYAMDSLLRRRADLHGVLKLLLVGTGPETRLAERYAREKGLEDCVHLLGFRPRKTLCQFYQAADIFALPSCIDGIWQEQFGRVLVEAMASGLAVVTTYSGSIDEVIGDAGVMVPPNDFYRLSRSIERLIDDTQLRHELGKRGRTRAVERFDTVSYVSQIGDVFDELR
jgi:starch synthase